MAALLPQDSEAGPTEPHFSVKTPEATKALLASCEVSQTPYCIGQPVSCQVGHANHFHAIRQGINYMQANLLNLRNMTRDILMTLDTLARDIRLHCIDLLFTDAITGIANRNVGRPH